MAIPPPHRVTLESHVSPPWFHIPCHPAPLGYSCCQLYGPSLSPTVLATTVIMRIWYMLHSSTPSHRPLLDTMPASTTPSLDMHTLWRTICPHHPPEAPQHPAPKGLQPRESLFSSDNAKVSHKKHEGFALRCASAPACICHDCLSKARVCPWPQRAVELSGNAWTLQPGMQAPFCKEYCTACSHKVLYDQCSPKRQKLRVTLAPFFFTGARPLLCQRQDFHKQSMRPFSSLFCSKDP